MKLQNAITKIIGWIFLLFPIGIAFVMCDWTPLLAYPVVSLQPVFEKAMLNRKYTLIKASHGP